MASTSSLKPDLWLLVFIVGLPLFSETVYTPSLPDIAGALSVPDAWVEYTLTIYLFGFALGSLLWGKLSDLYGRRPFVLIGFAVYILGCVGCFFSTTIGMLLFSRFIQALGGGAGSVLGQSISRDAFQGPLRGKVYSTVGSALSFSPAIGPVIGGILDQNLGWPSVFLFLIAVGSFVWFAVYFRLPETHPLSSRAPVSIKNVALRMMKDPKVIAFGFLMACCNGITFSYYAEGSFYLIDLLGLTPTLYGSTFLGIAFAGALGGFLSRQMHNTHSSLVILGRGIRITFTGALLFLVLTLVFYSFQAPPFAFIFLTLGSMIIMVTGIGMIIPNALSLSLEDYKYGIGAATSLFVFFYYTLISLVTMGMGMLHNDTLFPMPFYFCGIGLAMGIIYKKAIGVLSS